MQATMQARKGEAPLPQPEQPPIVPGWRKIGLRPEEGWATFIFLGFVLYSAVWSIQAMKWVNGLYILTWTTAVGLVLGFVSSKQAKLPRLLMHAITMAVGSVFAFWETATISNLSIGGLWEHLITWVGKAVTPNTHTSDDVMFLLFLAVLSFILA